MTADHTPEVKCETCGHAMAHHIAADAACYRCPADGKHVHQFKPAQPAVSPSSSERCAYAFCKHTRTSHQTVAYLDEHFPGRAPHLREHCTSCCEPESDTNTDCDHDFQPEPVQPRSRSVWDARQRVVTIALTDLPSRAKNIRFADTLDALIEAVAANERARYEALVKAALAMVAFGDRTVQLNGPVSEGVTYGVMRLELANHLNTLREALRGN